MLFDVCHLVFCERHNTEAIFFCRQDLNYILLVNLLADRCAWCDRYCFAGHLRHDDMRTHSLLYVPNCVVVFDQPHVPFFDVFMSCFWHGEVLAVVRKLVSKT